MEKSLVQIYQLLQQLTGLHRQLWDTVLLERDALVQASLKDLQTVTQTKQTLIGEIQQAESSRLKATGELAMAWKTPMRELSLPNIIVMIQAKDFKFAEQLRSAFNALTVLIQRITAQNDHNKQLVERSLYHINQMKKNALVEATPQSSTYNPRGQRTQSANSSRLISKEA